MRYSWLRHLMIAAIAAALYGLGALFLVKVQQHGNALFVVSWLAAVALLAPPIMVLREQHSVRGIFKGFRLAKVGLLLTALFFLAFAWESQLYGRMVSTNAVRDGAIVGAGLGLIWWLRSRRHYKKRGQLDAFNAWPKVVFYSMTVPLMTALLVMTLRPQLLHWNWQIWVALMFMAVLLVLVIVSTVHRRRKRRSSTK